MRPTRPLQPPLCEITRLPGLSIAVNSNGGAGNYLRFTIGDEGEDLTTVNRFLSNAGPHEQVNKPKAGSGT